MFDLIDFLRKLEHDGLEINRENQLLIAKKIKVEIENSVGVLGSLTNIIDSYESGKLSFNSMQDLEIEDALIEAWEKQEFSDGETNLLDYFKAFSFRFLNDNNLQVKRSMEIINRTAKLVFGKDVNKNLEVERMDGGKEWLELTDLILGTAKDSRLSKFAKFEYWWSKISSRVNIMNETLRKYINKQTKLSTKEKNQFNRYLSYVFLPELSDLIGDWYENKEFWLFAKSLTSKESEIIDILVDVSKEDIEDTYNDYCSRIIVSMELAFGKLGDILSSDIEIEDVNIRNTNVNLALELKEVLLSLGIANVVVLCTDKIQERDGKWIVDILGFDSPFDPFDYFTTLLSESDEVFIMRLNELLISRVSEFIFLRKADGTVKASNELTQEDIYSFGKDVFIDICKSLGFNPMVSWIYQMVEDENSWFIDVLDNEVWNKLFIDADDVMQPQSIADVLGTLINENDIEEEFIFAVNDTVMFEGSIGTVVGLKSGGVITVKFGDVEYDFYRDVVVGNDLLSWDSLEKIIL